ncbi:GvpL/GvpF family gas vesicle protein [Streptomyces sp. NPDC102402]|uniref:GvpL/GvpF family gas vesicle protein n=1 Tax=Streptomyces sp. NPDC102402 TaxID=3366169 RepID=UPI003820599B
MTASGSPGSSLGQGEGATYVFAICRSTRATSALDFTGMPGMPGGGEVRLLPCDLLTAVVQSVPAADFTDDVWQLRLSDRQDLERYARAHHAVVSAAAAAGAVVPLPLATLYHDDDRARSCLAEEAGRFHAALKRVSHHAEWGVKVYGLPASASETPVRLAAPSRAAPAPGAGAAYLQRKRGAQEQRERHHEQTLHIAESVDGEFRRVAAAGRRLRTHDAALSGDPRLHVLNATYLVADERADEIALLVKTLEESTGAQIELSGPWVPYSFVGEV